MRLRSVATPCRHGAHHLAADDFRPLLRPHLAAFARLHPEVSLEFALEDRLRGHRRRRFLTSAWHGEQIAADMVALQLGGLERLVTVGSPDYFRHPTPTTPESLEA